jgi:hypothetical protein
MSANPPEMYIRQLSLVLHLASPRDVYFTSIDNNCTQSSSAPKIEDTKLSSQSDELKIKKSPLLPGFPIRVIADYLIKSGDLTSEDRDIVEAVLDDCEEIAKRDCLLNEDREVLNAVLNLFDSGGALKMRVREKKGHSISETIPLMTICKEIMRSQGEIGLLLPGQLSHIFNKYAVAKKGYRRRVYEDGGNGNEPKYDDESDDLNKQKLSIDKTGTLKQQILTHVIVDISKLEDILGKE